MSTSPPYLPTPSQSFIQFNIKSPLKKTSSVFTNAIMLSQFSLRVQICITEKIRNKLILDLLVVVFSNLYDQINTLALVRLNNSG